MDATSRSNSIYAEKQQNAQRLEIQLPIQLGRIKLKCFLVISGSQINYPIHGKYTKGLAQKLSKYKGISIISPHKADNYVK